MIIYLIYLLFLSIAYCLGIKRCSLFIEGFYNKLVYYMSRDKFGDRQYNFCCSDCGFHIILALHENIDVCPECGKKITHLDFLGWPSGGYKLRNK